MYKDDRIVHSSLDVIMTYYTAGRSLLGNLCKIQLLVSSKRQKQYARVEKYLSHLKHDADTHSMWWLIDTPEHQRTSEDAIQSLKEITNMLRKRRDVLMMDQEYEPDTVMQDMLRNLGCFNVAFVFFNILQRLDKDDPGRSHLSLTFLSPLYLYFLSDYGNNSKEYKNTMDVIAACAEMFYWFIFDNKENQEIAYEELDLFFDNIDPLNSIGLHRIIQV